ncbi:MAG: pab [Blastococcus sp.]|jgi:para-aminobenzoate synthetase/4-amino-4-deoxychorismate lyase|nr:pab [Blastococcus sp.]
MAVELVGSGAGDGEGRPWARFDDLESGVALLCPPPSRVLTARRPEDVVPVLTEVERATAAGQWAFGYLAYEAAAGLDAALPVADPPADGPPLVWFGICDPPREVRPVGSGQDRHVPGTQWVPDWSDEDHRSAVARVRQHIAAGDTYQCNLTDRLRAQVRGDLEQLYAGLATAQRGAYNAYLDLGRHVVASASPELFFEWSGDRIRTRPMKGTAARGRSVDDDLEQARRLAASPKERAENLMIVDLLRNDLSKVARLGSVEVPALFVLERYPTLWQMTSEVTARTAAGVGLVDVFRALFPCGSVTGAPKRATMQLIRELEPRPRGVYCGAIGLLAPPGSPFRARFSVAIRTVVVDRDSGAALYGAGGGITWDSDPAAERAELRAKTAVLTGPHPEHELLETLGWSSGPGFRNLDRHLARLAGSAAYFGFPCDLAQVRTALDGAVEHLHGPARIRLRLDRSGHVAVDAGPAPAPLGRPVTLALDGHPIDSTSVWHVHKTTRREAYASRAARHPGVDDVVLVNERGEVTETCIATLAVRIDDRWWTPPTASGCLPGVERGRLLELGLLQERVLTVADLERAQGLAVVSSLRGWRPAVLVHDPSPGPRPSARGSLEHLHS